MADGKWSGAAGDGSWYVCLGHIWDWDSSPPPPQPPDGHGSYLTPKGPDEEFVNLKATV